MPVGTTEKSNQSTSAESHTLPPSAPMHLSSSSSPTTSVLPSSSSSPPKATPPSESLSTTQTPPASGTNPGVEVDLQRPGVGFPEGLSRYRLGPLIFGLYSNLVISLQVVAFLYLLPKISLPKFLLAAINNVIDFVNPFNTFT